MQNAIVLENVRRVYKGSFNYGFEARSSIRFGYTFSSECCKCLEVLLVFSGSEGYSHDKYGREE